MRKFIVLFLTLLMAVFIVSPALASVGVKLDGVTQGAATDINWPSGTTITTDGSTFTVTQPSGPIAAITSGTISGATITSSTLNSSVIGGVTPAAIIGTTVNGTTITATTGNIINVNATIVNSPTISATTITLSTPNVGTVELPINSFLFQDTGTPLTTATTPGLEIDNLIPDIVWSDGETSAVMVTFKIPSDYLSGGAFRLFCDSSNSTTPEQVDFDVYVNGNNTAWDAAATDQTPVAISTGAGTPCIVTLTPAVDFATLAAEKVVTLRTWRDNVSDGTGDLEVSYAEFYYNRK